MAKKQSKYSKEMIQELLLTNPRALARGVVAIYKRQTDAEQSAGTTKEANGRGFTGVDAAILSSFALQLLGGPHSYRTLSAKQTAIAMKCMPKYWKQLIEVAEMNDALRVARAANAARDLTRKEVAA